MKNSVFPVELPLLVSGFKDRQLIREEKGGGNFPSLFLLPSYIRQFRIYKLFFCLPNFGFSPAVDLILAPFFFITVSPLASPFSVNCRTPGPFFSSCRSDASGSANTKKRYRMRKLEEMLWDSPGGKKGVGNPAEFTVFFFHFFFSLFSEKIGLF